MVGSELNPPARTMLLACPNCATIYDVKAEVIGDDGRSLRCARCQLVWFATKAQELVFAEPTVAGPKVAEPKPGRQAAEPAAPPPAPADDILAAAAAMASPKPFAPRTENPSELPQLEAPPLATGSSASFSTRAIGSDIETAAKRRAREQAERVNRLRAQFGPPAIIAILGLVVSALIAWRVNIVQVVPQMASFYAGIGLPVNLRELVIRDVKTSFEMHDGVPVLLVEGEITSLSRQPVEVPNLRMLLRDANRRELYSWTAKPEQTTLAPGATLAFRTRLASPPGEGRDVVVRFLNKNDPAEGAR